MVQVPPRGLWGRSGAPALTTLENWLGAEVSSTPDPDAMVLRLSGCLRARECEGRPGAWSGLTRLAEVFERLRPGLINFVNAKGTEVFDLPDAPRPTSGTPPGQNPCTVRQHLALARRPISNHGRAVPNSRLHRERHHQARHPGAREGGGICDGDAGKGDGRVGCDLCLRSNRRPPSRPSRKKRVRC